MQTPVFLDHLPDEVTISGSKSERYRILRNRALLDLLSDESQSWQPRDCPACGASRAGSQTFGQAFLPFQRCLKCNTIYAARVPDQAVLDRLRLDQSAARPAQFTEEEDSQARDFEFTSILNWISLTAGRTGRPLSDVLDYRFTTHAPRWQDAVDRLSHNRSWRHLPLVTRTGDSPFADLAQAIDNRAPEAILIQAEMDRIAEPATLLRTIRDHAPKGTLVFIASSCADGLEYELLGADSRSFIPLDRLNVFSTKGISTLAQELSFTVQELSTPGRRDAVILAHHFRQANNSNVPFWSSFFRDADPDRLSDLQILLQRSLRSSLLRCILEL